MKYSKRRRPSRPRRVSRPSHATVVAYLALFVALGGVSYAVTIAPRNSVNSASIINDTARGIDVKESSLRGVTDRCPSPLTVRRGRICAGADGVARIWFDAKDFCSALDLRLPTSAEALALATHDVPGVASGDKFWGQELYRDFTTDPQGHVTGSQNVSIAYDENGSFFSSESLGSMLKTVCVTEPTDSR